jgi:O-antigen ligase
VLSDVAFDLFKRRPLLGEGYATFDQAKFSFAVSPEDTYIVETTTSHDTLLTVLAESGVVGALLLMLPWILIAWRAITAARHRVVAPWLVAGCVGATVTYVGGALTYDARFFPFIFAIPWITLGVARRLLSDPARVADPV